MTNREITKDEINEITGQCPSLREKAFFTVMRQSGLPPRTVRQLKINHVEKMLEPDTPIPCKISVSSGRFPTFIGHEAVESLKRYLADRSNRKRQNLTPQSLLFTAHNNQNKEINTKDVSRAFARAAQKLKNRHKITYEVRKGKPSELRLYSLIDFYRTNTKPYFKELNNNAPKDDGFYRKLYQEEAMPYLEIQPLTPLQQRRLKKQLEERNKDIDAMKETIVKIQPLVEFVNTFDDYENLRKILNFFKMEILDDYEGLPDRLRSIKTEFSPYIRLKLTEIAKTMNITEKEALKKLFADDVEAMKKAEERWAEIEKRLKPKPPKLPSQSKSPENPRVLGNVQHKTAKHFQKIRPRKPYRR